MQSTSLQGEKQLNKLHDDELVDWLRIIRSEAIGPVTFHKLRQVYGSAPEIIKNLPDIARRKGKGDFIITSKKEAEEEIQQLRKLGGTFVSYGSTDYPKHLASIYGAPPLLSVLGDVNLLTKTHQYIAIVGSRNASANGKKIAYKLAIDLSHNGWIIVSGMARGIDADAHRGAINSNTISVLGTGVNHPYPQENTKLYENLLNRGNCIVSEYPLNTPPLNKNFPRRNRIIAGLSLGIIVVEATMHSGSLITAKYALDYGRDVFSVPGSPQDPRCRGTNELLRQGAILTESSQDIFNNYNQRLGMLSDEKEPDSTCFPHPTDDKENNKAIKNKALRLLGGSPTTFQDLLDALETTPSCLTRALLELELAGMVERLPGGRIVKLL